MALGVLAYPVLKSEDYKRIQDFRKKMTSFIMKLQNLMLLLFFQWMILNRRHLLLKCWIKQKVKKRLILR
jgi:uncharacterized membrane protein (DUF485 family)